MPSVPLPPVLASPIIRRVAWHLRRVSGQLDRRFFLSLAEGIVVVVAHRGGADHPVRKADWTFQSLFDSFNWGIATVLGAGDSTFVTSPGGRIVSWLLILFGVAMLGMITGALVAMVIDFLLKEGQGLGSSGHKDHIIVCGWNSTARDLIDELKGDDYPQKVVVLADLDKNPAGSGVYFVRGDATNAEDLERAGIADASAALVFPVDGSDEADMHSILAIMAIDVDRAPGAHGRRGQQPEARAALRSRRASTSCSSRPRSRRGCWRAPRCTRACPRSSPTSCPAARARSSTGSRCRTTTSGSPSTRSRRCCATTTRPRCCPSTAAAARSSTRRADFVLQAGDDAIVVAEGLGYARAAQAARHQRPCRGPPRWCPAPDPATGDPERSP